MSQWNLWEEEELWNAGFAHIYQHDRAHILDAGSDEDWILNWTSSSHFMDK